MPKHVPKLISPEDWMKLYHAAKPGRDQLILAMLYGTGCRVGELAASKVEDLDLDAGVLHLSASRTKTNHYRVVLIPPDVHWDLKKWTARLPQNSEWIFPGQKPGSYITPLRVRQIIHRAAEKAGIQRVYGHDKNGRPLYVVSPHTLRHAHAVSALDAGVPLNDLQSQLGHSNLATTSVYLNTNLEHRRRSYERAGFGVLK